MNLNNSSVTEHPSGVTPLVPICVWAAIYRNRLYFVGLSTWPGHSLFHLHNKNYLLVQNIMPCGDDEGRQNLGPDFRRALTVFYCLIFWTVNFHRRDLTERAEKEALRVLVVISVQCSVITIPGLTTDGQRDKNLTTCLPSACYMTTE